MRKFFIAIAALLCTSAASAQQIKALDADIEDVINVLQLQGNKIHSFDISQMLDKEYIITLYIKEYQGAELKTTTTEELGENINPYGKADKLGIYIVSQNDSTKLCSIDLRNMNTSIIPLKLQPLTNSEKRSFVYESTPFEIGKFKEGAEIPLAMYGSFWYDENFKFHRFCGESTLSPDMSSEMLKQSPHYYIFSVKFDKVTN